MILDTKNTSFLVMIKKFENFTSTIIATVIRFPLATVLAFIYFSTLFMQTYGQFEKYQSHQEQLTCLYGILLFISLQLLAESRRISNIIINLIGIVILTSIAWYNYDSYLSEKILLVLGLITSIYVAPFSAKKPTGNQVSYFGCILCARILITIGAYLVVFLGGYFIIYSVNYLFYDSSLPSEIIDNFTIRYIIVTSFVFCVSFMAFIPKSFHKDKIKNTGILKVLSYILLPMLCIYAIILHAYIFKLILNQSVPSNFVGIMVSNFGAIGIVTYLIAYCIRDQNTISFAIRHFPKLLLLPTALLAVAIYIRISEYGLTESRYLVALCGLWIAISTISMFWVTQAPKLIIAATATLLILSSFGPWSITKLPLYSQTHKLEALLHKNHILVDGQLVQAHNKISKEDQAAIKSTVHYIFVHKGLRLIQPWFSQTAFDSSTVPSVILQAIGIEE
jgi:hypothetical protein